MIRLVKQKNQIINETSKKIYNLTDETDMEILCDDINEELKRLQCEEIFLRRKIGMIKTIIKKEYDCDKY